ncbi:unnamed protein product [Cylicocyclus nassatus]|uniref:Uncharacterized protein n=1 Tax=Cylicocyclus nassatus TaxID=53992 RepID=A0AA36HEM1_CYLNA|nr:unnamed protein product [Cylicocyclus nassatus]
MGEVSDFLNKCSKRNESEDESGNADRQPSQISANLAADLTATAVSSGRARSEDSITTFGSTDLKDLKRCTH